MNLWVIVILIAILFGLRKLCLPMLIWMVVWPVAVYVFIRYGLTPHVPSSVLNIYLGVTILGLLAYLVADQERYERVRDQLTTFVLDKRYDLALKSVVILLPIALAAKVYCDLSVEVRALTFGRTIHPAPPGSITYKGKTIDLIKGKNPYRELETSDPEAFAQHVKNGKRVYYQNCVYCHGDDMRGDGVYAHGLNPVPANFNSATAIAMLQESYLFWRIAKGGPGLPDESGPWSSSMPAWEKFLEEEEVWDVVLYLYEHTGLKPRAQEEHH